MKPANNEEEETVNSVSVAYHVLHKLPSGDSPYVRAKHLQFAFIVNYEYDMIT
ncbi:hypothetical protein HanOQP8_Chr01g0028011 [Helianthus annuus]|nr:hypothetical protein HanOQP8_Chr01g0028011 [Helianthus annuus]